MRAYDDDEVLRSLAKHRERRECWFMRIIKCLVVWLCIMGFFLAAACGDFFFGTYSGREKAALVSPSTIALFWLPLVVLLVLATVHALDQLTMRVDELEIRLEDHVNRALVLLTMRMEELENRHEDLVNRFDSELGDHELQDDPGEAYDGDGGR